MLPGCCDVPGHGARRPGRAHRERLEASHENRSDRTIRAHPGAQGGAGPHPAHGNQPDHHSGLQHGGHLFYRADERPRPGSRRYPVPPPVLHAHRHRQPVRHRRLQPHLPEPGGRGSGQGLSGRGLQHLGRRRGRRRLLRRHLAAAPGPALLAGGGFGHLPVLRRLRTLDHRAGRRPHGAQRLPGPSGAGGGRFPAIQRRHRHGRHPEHCPGPHFDLWPWAGPERHWPPCCPTLPPCSTLSS